MTTRRYDQASIERAFRFHESQTGDFELLEVRPAGFRVRIQGEVEALSNREAWLLALGLATGRTAGLKTATEETAEEWVCDDPRDLSVGDIGGCGHVNTADDDCCEDCGRASADAWAGPEDDDWIHSAYESMTSTL